MSRSRAIAWAATGLAAAAGFFLALPEPGDVGSTRAAPGFAVRDVRVFDGVLTLPRATVVVRDARVERRRYPERR